MADNSNGSPRITLTAFESDFGVPTPLATPTPPLQAKNPPSFTFRLEPSMAANMSTYGTLSMASSLARTAPARAKTAAPTISTSNNTMTQLSRPILTRAISTTTPLHPSAATAQARPTLLHRLPTTATTLLDLDPSTSFAQPNAPPQPSHWTDHAHRAALLSTWDSIHEAAASSKSKYPGSVTGQLVAVEKSLVLQFPELGDGERVLGREWMEFVLGLAGRSPWCTSEKMGRWEILSAVNKVGGGRGWGPW